jgi:hypothetical protein
MTAPITRNDVIAGNIGIGIDGGIIFSNVAIS